MLAPGPNSVNTGARRLRDRGDGAGSRQAVRRVQRQMLGIALFYLQRIGSDRPIDAIGRIHELDPLALAVDEPAMVYMAGIAGIAVAGFAIGNPPFAGMGAAIPVGAAPIGGVILDPFAAVGIDAVNGAIAQQIAKGVVVGDSLTALLLGVAHRCRETDQRSNTKTCDGPPQHRGRVTLAQCVIRCPLHGRLDNPYRSATGVTISKPWMKVGISVCDFGRAAVKSRLQAVRAG